MQLTALGKTLLFNRPFLPSSCGHLTGFAQGLSSPFKSSCCAVKALDLAYASEPEIIKVTDPATLGIAKKCTGTWLVCDTPRSKLPFL